MTQADQPPPDALQPWQWPEARWRGIVEKVRAGRSLKPTSWPGRARVAVALSFDSDHESGELREGGSSPGRLSQGQYGNRVGVPRILALLKRHGVPASFFVPAVIALLYRDERDLMLRAADTLETITGRRPVGMRTPSWDYSQHTLAIIREMGLAYDSSLMADDEPYELVEDGEPTGIIELPVEWIRDDAVYFNMNRYSALRPYTPPSAVLEIFKSEFDEAVKEKGLFLLTMHPHYIGHRSRLALLDQLIAHIKSTPGVWFATHAQVAEYCKAHPG